MLRSLPPRGADAVHVLGKVKREQGEKQAGNFQPKHLAGVGKWAQEPLPKGLNPAFGGHYPGAKRRGRRWRPAISGFGSLLHPLAEHIRGYPDANPQRAAYLLWLHGKSLPAG
jgi:hypothetical protein